MNRFLFLFVLFGFLVKSENVAGGKEKSLFSDGSSGKRVEVYSVYDHDLEMSQVFFEVGSDGKRKLKGFYTRGFCVKRPVSFLLCKKSEKKVINPSYKGAVETNSFLRLQNGDFCFLLKKAV